MWNLGKLQVVSVGSSPPRRPPEAGAHSHLFFWNLQQEVHLPCDFVVHPIRWDRCPLVAADPHARSWLTIQSHRGLAYNTLDAYSRCLERYLSFLGPHQFSCVSVSVCAAAPTVSEEGDSDVTVGTGLLEGGVPPTALELPPPHAEANSNGMLRRSTYAKQRSLLAEFRRD
jgi:hypothetical protein